MTAGGNNAQFFNIADGCVFHSDITRGYGPDYDQDPGRTGACAVAIDASTNYITNTIGQDLTNVSLFRLFACPLLQRS